MKYTEHGLSEEAAAVLRLEMAGWVDGLVPWQVFGTLTFKPRAAFQSGKKFYSERVQQPALRVGTSYVAGAEIFERMMSRSHPDTDYFYATETNPGLVVGSHIHTLLRRPMGIYRKEFWKQWDEKHGFAEFQPIRSRDDVVSYCAKYVTKERTWWNVKIVHPPGIAGKDFKLI